jgi:putative peptidoglycan lipid II flippase
MSSRTILKWTGIVTVLLVVSRVLGLFREVAIASRFSVSLEADAYMAAAVLPTILYVAFNDAIKTAFIPVYGEYHKSDRGHELVVTSFVILGVLLTVVSALLVYFAPILVRLLFIGFTGEKYAITVVMARILLPNLVFMGLAGLCSGILHTKRNFVVPAIPAYSSNLIIMFTAIFLGARYGILGLAWGTTVGFASQFFVQLPSVAKHGVFRGKLDLRHPGLIKMGRVLPPVLLGGAAIEVKSVVDRLFGSLLPDGAISSLSYANRIYLMPNGILILALLTVMYPTLVELSAEGKMKDFKDTFRQGAGLIVVVMLPIMVGLVILREPLVRMIFERNQFDPAATALTATALGFYGISLLPLGIMLLIKRTFFSLKDTLTPMLLMVVMQILNIFFNWILIKPLGHGGIALGTSLAVYLGTAGLAFLLWRKIGAFGGHLLIATVKKSLLATLVMGALVAYGMRFLPPGGLSHALALFIVIGFGAIVYLGIIYKLQVEELDFALDMVRGRFGRHKH